jgi:hypothetical protein
MNKPYEPYFYKYRTTPADYNDIGDLITFPSTSLPSWIAEPDWATETFEGHTLEEEIEPEGYNLLLKHKPTGLYFLTVNIDFE